MAQSIIHLRPWQSSLNGKHLKVYFTRANGDIFDKVVPFFTVVNKNTRSFILWSSELWWIYLSDTVKPKTRNSSSWMDFALNWLEVNGFRSSLTFRLSHSYNKESKIDREK
jgi:hypothetical protein